MKIISLFEDYSIYSHAVLVFFDVLLGRQSNVR